MNKDICKLLIKRHQNLNKFKNNNINMNGTPGIFKITIKDGIITKELKNIKDIMYIQVYYKIVKNLGAFSNIIMNIHNNSLFGNFIEPALNIRGTTYSMRYISNSICLNNFEEIKKLSIEIKEDIKKQIIIIFNILKNNYPNIKGDWMPWNLIYDKDSKKVLNIDLEGFFSYDEKFYRQNSKNSKNIWIINPEIKILDSLN